MYRALLPANHAQIERLYHADIHPLILSHAADHFKDDIAHRSDMFVFREPDSLLLPPASLDLILSGGALHWVNDLPAIVSQLVHRLSPDGLFLAAMLGGETLQELRISLQLAEQELRQRLAPRISPMIRVADAAHLLTAVGLALPTVDVERVVVQYPDIWALMRHIRGMGEGNALTAREPHCGRDVFDRAGEIYAQEFGDSDGLPATFEIIHLIGWRKATGQQRPSGRGSADVSLSDLVDSSQKSN